MDKESEFFTVEEIAMMLKVTPETIRRYCRSGQLRAVRLSGRFLRIDHKDFEEFIEKLKTKPLK